MRAGARAIIMAGCIDFDFDRARGWQGGGEGGVDDEMPKLTRGQLIRVSSGMLGLMFGWAMKVIINIMRCALPTSRPGGEKYSTITLDSLGWGFEFESPYVKIHTRSMYLCLCLTFDTHIINSLLQ